MTSDPSVCVKYTLEGENWPAYGRAARMIRWVCEHEETINATRKGELRFCFAGNSLSVHTVNVDDTI